MNAFLSAEYTPEDVARHKTAKDRIWVSYKDEVFDITDFVQQHPGGQSRIMLAAGGAIDPFWQLYAQHTNNPEVSKILRQFRIGKLRRPAGQPAPNAQDPYANDPARSPFFKVSAAKPFNAEPPLPLLVDTHHTPNDAFFVRNHLPVPQVIGDQYQLKVEVEGQPQTLKISLKDLETKFQQYAVVASVQCAGNRRGEMIELKPIKGLGWNAGAISNAQWTGVLLRDVLQAAGFSENDLTKYSHVQFEGLDRDMTGTFYGSSIPLDKAWDPKGDVLLALTMNGQPLPRDHGYPVRVVAPGTASVKFLWLVDCALVD
jgi:sulfite oxidase